MSSSPGASFSAGGFKKINDALQKIIDKANAAEKAISGVFSNPAISQDALEQLARDLNMVADGFGNIRRQSLLATRAIARFARVNGGRAGRGVSGGLGGGSGGQGGGSGGGTGGSPPSGGQGGGQPDGFWRRMWNATGLLARAQRNLQSVGFNMFKNKMAWRTLMGGSDSAIRSTFGRGAGMLGLSRYAPGQTGIAARYRVFQKPFPGSDRNVFSLGDTAAVGQNLFYGFGNQLENSFRVLTGSATAVNRAFAGIVTGGIGIFSPFLGGILGSLSDALISMFEKLSAVVGSVIGSLTRMGTALIGFATRAVEAASNLTEAVNAANVIAGPKASAEMLKYATQLQRDYGLSVTDGMKAMGRMAGMMRNLGGFSQEESGMTARSLYRYAVDIGSVVNKSAEEVGIAMMSGFAGRLTPLRRFMIGMQAPQLDMMAKDAGITRPGMRVDYEARIRMFVEEFARQGGLFLGDLERTRYEFANQRRRMMGQFEALMVSVGRGLEPFGKVLLMAANDVLGNLIDFLDPFTNNTKTNMVMLTSMERFRPAIESFIWYVLAGKNAMVNLASSIWASRTMILEYAWKLGEAFAALTAGITTYSLNVVNMAISLINRLISIIPTITSFGKALAGLANWIDRNILGGTGGDSTPQQTRELFNKLQKDIQAQEARAAAKPGSVEAAVAMNQAGVLRRMLQEVSPFLGGSRTSGAGPLGSSPNMSVAPDRSIPQDQYKKLAEAAGIKTTYFDPITDQILNDLGFTMASIKKAATAFGDFRPKPGDVSKIWSMIQPVTALGNTVAPRPEVGGGRLVQYFDPARFRDAVQERDTSASRTAIATERSADLLQTMVESMKANPTNPLSPMKLQSVVAP